MVQGEGANRIIEAPRTAAGLPEGKTRGELPVMEQDQKKTASKPFPPTPDRSLQMHEKMSFASVRCGWRWHIVVSISAKLRR